MYLKHLIDHSRKHNFLRIASICLGILISVKVGGLLFDATLEDGGRFFSGPFVFIGVLNVAVLLWAFIAAKKIKSQHS